MLPRQKERERRGMWERAVSFFSSSSASVFNESGGLGGIRQLCVLVILYWKSISLSYKNRIGDFWPSSGEERRLDSVNFLHIFCWCSFFKRQTDRRRGNTKARAKKLYILKKVSIQLFYKKYSYLARIWVSLTRSRSCKRA